MRGFSGTAGAVSSRHWRLLQGLGRVTRRVTRRGTGTNDPYPNGVYFGAPSPDGGQIAFSDDRRYDDFCCSDLFVMNANGSHQHRIPLGGVAGVNSVSWGSAPLLP